MGHLFKDFDCCPPPIGALGQRRRTDLPFGVDVYEILLGQDYLMTGLFTDSDVAIGGRGVAACDGDAPDHTLNDRNDSFYFPDRQGAAYPDIWAEPVILDTPLAGRPFTQVDLARVEVE